MNGIRYMLMGLSILVTTGLIRFLLQVGLTAFEIVGIVFGLIFVIVGFFGKEKED